MPFSDLIFPLEKHLTLPKGPVNRIHCDWLDDSVITESKPERGLVLRPFGRLDLLKTEVKSSGFLTKPNADKPVFYLDLSIQGDVDLLPGDTIGVFVKNDSNRVNKLLQRLGLNSEKPCKLKGSVPSHLPSDQPTTPSFILTHWVDLDTPIKKAGLVALSEWAKDSEVRRLQELASREAPPTSSPITLEFLLDVLPSLTPDLSTILNLLTPFKPRVYSVANEPVTDTESQEKLVRIILSLVEGGLASTYLYNLVKNQSDLSVQLSSLALEGSTKKCEELFIYLRKRNDFTIPGDVLNDPLIMVATGTGISPFIGMLEHREKYIKDKTTLVNKHDELAPWFLIHGCRDEAHHILRSEVKHFIDAGVLKEQFTCYSRDPESDQPKYVQDCLVQEREVLIPLLLDNDKTVMMVCGEASKMVPSFTAAVSEAVHLLKNNSKEEAALQVTDLIKSKKLVFDAWVL